MKLLLVNTCGGADMVALADTSLPDPIIASEPLPGRSSSEQIIPAVRRMFTEAAWESRHLEAVAVVHGPGSFTGVRVGLSTAKGLCEATGAHMLAISRLALVAVAADTPDEILALLDAGRGEFYCGLYRRRECIREALLRREEVLALVPGRIVVTSEPRVAESLTPLEVRLVAEPGAREILRLAKERIAEQSWTDVATIDANYLRRTDAELLMSARPRAND